MIEAQLPPMVTNLYIITGSALYAAIQHVALTSLLAPPRALVQLMFVLMSLSLAGFALATALSHAAAPPVVLIGLGKLIVAMGLLFWLSLIWFCTLYANVRTPWVPLALSTGLGAMFFLNLVAPTSLVYLNFGRDIVPDPGAGDERRRLNLSAVSMDLLSPFSVYMRFCTSQAQIDTYCKRNEKALPDGGKVNILTFTDKQYERIVSYFGKAKQPAKKSPDQFDLF